MATTALKRSVRERIEALPPSLMRWSHVRTLAAVSRAIFFDWVRLGSGARVRICSGRSWSRSRCWIFLRLRGGDLGNCWRSGRVFFAAASLAVGSAGVIFFIRCTSKLSRWGSVSF